MVASGVVLLAPPPIRWWCPACPATDATTEVQPHVRMHTCAGMGGLTAPMLREGERGQHKLVEREDYEGDEDGLTRVDGRPIMSLVTTRDSGQDCTVFAPTARRAVGD